MWYRTHESELENGLYYADNARTHVSYMLCLTARKSTYSTCVIVYEMYNLPNIWLTLILINLRMRFEQIAFVHKRTVPPE